MINAATAIKKHERTYHPITLSTHEEFSVDKLTLATRWKIMNEGTDMEKEIH